MKRNNSGFTMVELLVTVAVSSIVLAAAASLMLLGLRVHQTTQKEAGEQQTVRIVLSALEDLCSRRKILIGILTVPAAAAQGVCDLLIRNGIKAIWNFAPTHLDVPPQILVQNENMATSLAVLSKHLSAQMKGY